MTSLTTIKNIVAILWAAIMNTLIAIHAIDTLNANNAIDNMLIAVVIIAAITLITYIMVDSDK